MQLRDLGIDVLRPAPDGRRIHSEIELVHEEAVGVSLDPRQVEQRQIADVALESAVAGLAAAAAAAARQEGGQAAGDAAVLPQRVPGTDGQVHRTQVLRDVAVSVGVWERERSVTEGHILPPCYALGRLQTGLFLDCAEGAAD